MCVSTSRRAKHAHRRRQRQSRRPWGLTASGMRGFRAMVALNNVLHVGAFLLPISSVLRGNTAPKSTFSPALAGTPTTCNSAALRRRLTLSAGSTDEGLNASPAVLPPSGKPVLSFPGGGIFFWVSPLGCLQQYVRLMWKQQRAPRQQARQGVRER